MSHDCAIFENKPKWYQQIVPDSGLGYGDTNMAEWTTDVESWMSHVFAKSDLST
jgi:hypothetical protein